MIAKEGQVTAALDRAGAGIRLFLLHGADESALRLLADRLGRAIGAEAERIDLDEATLRDDPARLCDEASALSLFGTRRWVRATGGEAVLPAVDALLSATAATEPVVLIAPALKPTSALLKRAIADPTVMAYQAYKVEGERAEGVVIAAGRVVGLKIEPRLARQLADACANDRALIARECEKFALFLDAAPDRPRELTPETMEALSADAAEANVFAVVDAAFDGEPATLMRELETMAEGAANPIPILRLAGRRALMLAGFRAKVENGRSVGSIMDGDARYLKGKERDAIGRQLARWPAARLATIVSRLFGVEEQLKYGQVGAVAAHDELLAIARVGAKLR